MRKGGRFEKLILKGVLWIATALLIVFAVFILGATWEIWQKQQKALQEKENAQEKYEEVQERYTMLESEVKRLSNDRGREEEFRKRFPVARDGEEVFVLIDAAEPIIDVSQTPSRDFWATILSWFTF